MIKKIGYEDANKNFKVVELAPITLITESDEGLSNLFQGQLLYDVDYGQPNFFVFSSHYSFENTQQITDIVYHYNKFWIRELTHPNAKKGDIRESIKYWQEEMFGYVDNWHNLIMRHHCQSNIVEYLHYNRKGSRVYLMLPDAVIHPRRLHVLVRMCRILAQNGVQVFIYTRSEVLFNAFRVDIKDKFLSPDDFICVFAGDDGVETLKLDENAKIINWHIPQGFFWA